MRREREPEDRIAAWTLDSDWDLIKNKSGATRPGFCLLLKFSGQEARFPRHAGELPARREAGARVRYLSIRILWRSGSGRRAVEASR